MNQSLTSNSQPRLPHRDNIHIQRVKCTSLSGADVTGLGAVVVTTLPVG